MKKLFITLFFSVLSVANMCAQDWRDAWTDQHWTNGWQLLSSLRINDSQVLISASAIGDFYYYLFEIKSFGEGNYDLKSISLSEITTSKKKLNSEVREIMDHEACADTEGMIWKRRLIGDHDVLVKCFPDNTISTAFVNTGREASEVMNDDLMDIIAGKYTTAKGVKFEFKNDGTCVFNGKATSYAMASKGEYDSPSLHIWVNDGLYEVVPTIEGMNIYPASIPEGCPGPVTSSKPYAQLIVSKDAPRWGFLSWRICSDGAFGLLNKDVLRLMRNEMFAARGYRFSDAKLQKYFQRCKWYKPAKDNSAVRLNDVEQLHVSLLKKHEK